MTDEKLLNIDHIAAILKALRQNDTHDFLTAVQMDDLDEAVEKLERSMKSKIRHEPKWFNIIRNEDGTRQNDGRNPVRKRWNEK